MAQVNGTTGEFKNSLSHFFFLSHKAKVTIDPCRFNGTVSVLKVNDVRLMFHSNLIGEMILLTLKM